MSYVWNLNAPYPVIKLEINFGGQNGESPSIKIDTEERFVEDFSNMFQDWEGALRPSYTESRLEEGFWEEPETTELYINGEKRLDAFGNIKAIAKQLYYTKGIDKETCQSILNIFSKLSGQQEKRNRETLISQTSQYRT